MSNESIDYRQFGDNLTSTRVITPEAAGLAFSLGRQAARLMTTTAREIYGPSAVVEYCGFQEWGGFSLTVCGGSWGLGHTAAEAAEHLRDFVNNPMAQDLGPENSTDSTGTRSWFAEVA